MKKKDFNTAETPKKGLWGIIDRMEGDKVIWIITLLLILISVLAIFSSTPLLSEKSRIEIMTEHGAVAIGGLLLILFLYKFVTKIGIYRVLSQFGFIISFVLLLILDTHADLGFIKAQYINKAWRTLGFFGLQIHVFEVAKVAMVMYLAWALHAYKQDCEAIKNGVKSKSFRIANALSKIKHLSFLANPLSKRFIYIYIPSLLITAMILPGSNSSAIFMAIVLCGTMLIGGIPFRDVIIAGICGILAFAGAFGLYKVSDGEILGRMETFEGRLGVEYNTERLDTLPVNSVEYYDELDRIRQPYGAKLAIHEGGLIGKGSGNSTQKYSVTHIYSDYMFSFLIEEYGIILGGVLIVILYISLIARSSMIARLCKNEFAKIAVGGLSFLITGQAFLHMLVNVDIIPMTGQTLPLISDGASAFLVFCLAFGIILSISKMAKRKMDTVEEAAQKNMNTISENIKRLEQTEDETL